MKNEKEACQGLAVKLIAAEKASSAKLIEAAEKRIDDLKDQVEKLKEELNQPRRGSVTKRRSARTQVNVRVQKCSKTVAGLATTGARLDRVGAQEGATGSLRADKGGRHI